MFKTDFDSHVCEGDSISGEVDGITLTARLERDPDTNPHDYDWPGWCFDTKAPKTGKRSRAILDAWDSDEWHYFSVVIDARVGDIDLGRMTSLSGLEGNLPSRAKNPNTHFRHAANNMWREAVETAKRRCIDMVAKLSHAA